MLESFNTTNEMKYQKLSAEEQQERGILGRLVGVIADFRNRTRNGRRYTEELWEKTFNDPIMKEKFENRCLFGELGHPADRQEVDMEKICICLAEVPKKGNDGKLYGVFDILNTPNGRILKTMCDYGCKIGVSSRGSGDTFEDYDGGETVEPDSYDCECWDAVLLPAVKEARLKYVTESLDTTKTLKKALQEELNKSTEDEQRTMKETLDDLQIDYATDQEEENTSTPVDDIDVTNEEKDQAAEDSGALMIQELQESALREKELEQQIKTLQEKLSVCYTKEARYSDVLTRTNQELKTCKATNQQLQEQLNAANVKAEKTAQIITEQKTQIDSLVQRVKLGNTKRAQLTESVSSTNEKVKSLEEDLKAEQARSKKLTEKLQAENKTLTEQLADRDKDVQIIKSQASAKVTQSQQIVERYKTIAKTAVDKYISSQASRLGIKPSEIKDKLNENFIDAINAAYGIKKEVEIEEEENVISTNVELEPMVEEIEVVEKTKYKTTKKK